MAESGNSNVWVDLLGPNLLKKAGGVATDVTTETALQGKFVALYFSAHWCGPCRGFTPRLVEQYKKIVDVDKKNWEIVFCSSDSDQSAFDTYYKEMPWLALSYKQRDLKNKLSSKYKVNGIPTLVLLNTEGELISTSGRSKVMDASGFPWLPVPFERCFANVTEPDFNINKGVKVLYFSAHWCGPCRSFTPLLKEVYAKVKPDNQDFQVVFVTSDRKKEEFDTYFGEMPWAALPFEDSDERASLEEKYDVSGIPSMVVLQDGKLLNPSAVGSIRQAGGDPFDATKAAAAFPWKQNAVEELSMGTAENLNNCPCVILFQDKDLDAAAQKMNASFLQTAASAELENALNGKERKVAFYTHNEDHERISGMMKKMMPEVETNNAMVILHFGDNGAYYVADLPKSEADVNKFVADFHAKKLERKQANPPR